MKNKKLKEGDYIYCLEYYNFYSKSIRTLRKCKILKVCNINYKLRDEYVPKSHIGINWFKTEKEAYKNALNHHLKKYKDIIKEIEYLKRKSK